MGANRFWTILSLAALFLAGVTQAMAQTAAIREILTNPIYRPQICLEDMDPCILTGPGGSVREWEFYIDMRFAEGHSYRVVGRCASACELAYRRALEIGATVIVDTDAELIYHEVRTLMPDK